VKRNLLIATMFAISLMMVGSSFAFANTSSEVSNPEATATPVLVPSGAPMTVKQAQLALGKGFVCKPLREQGGFTTVNDFDAIVVNTPEASFIAMPAPAGWYWVSGIVSNIRCNNQTPAEPPEYFDARAFWEGPCGWNRYNVVLNVNALSSRDVTYSIRRVNSSGVAIKQKVTVPVGQVYNSGIFQVAPGTQMWVQSVTTGERLFQITTVPKGFYGTCPVITKGFTYN
jgi:hypothetical protein